jgi:hypothetical protein
VARAPHSIKMAQATRPKGRTLTTNNSMLASALPLTGRELEPAVFVDGKPALTVWVKTGFVGELLGLACAACVPLTKGTKQSDYRTRILTIVTISPEVRPQPPHCD